MENQIKKAALTAGFIEARPAAAHPFVLWRSKLDGLPIGKRITMEHRPEALSGWPTGGTTAWAALYPTPSCAEWPDGHGMVAGYYFASNEAKKRAALWENSVKAAGYETLTHSKLPARAIAIRAGLGVHGLNGLLITPYGSFVYIAAMLVHSPPPNGTPGPEADFSPGCENCGACRSACPSGAISELGVDGLKCINYSMYHQSFAPESHYPLMGDRVRGCDECQRVCPHNAGAEYIVPDAEQSGPFELGALLRDPDLDAIARLIGKNYAKANKLRTQAALAAANTRRTDLIPALREHIGSDYDPLRKAVAWALGVLSADDSQRYSGDFPR